MAGVPHPDISTLCIFQICLPVDLVWPWPKCPWCTCSLMLSPLRSLPKRQQSNTKIAFWQFSSWLWWQESREILGLRHELRLMGLCCPSDAALPTRAWKLPGGEKHRASSGSPVSECTLSRQSLPAASKIKNKDHLFPVFLGYCKFFAIQHLLQSEMDGKTDKPSESFPSLVTDQISPAYAS